MPQTPVSTGICTFAGIYPDGPNGPERAHNPKVAAFEIPPPISIFRYGKTPEIRGLSDDRKGGHPSSAGVDGTRRHPDDHEVSADEDAHS
jgi:hypothetical protein